MLIKMMRKYKNILIKVLENYTFIKIFRIRMEKLPFLPKFRQFSQFTINFIEKSIISNRFYIEISIILWYIYVEKSIIFG